MKVPELIILVMKIVQAHAQEALEYDQVINLVHNYTKNADVDTVVVATADHETGGLVLNQNTK